MEWKSETIAATALLRDWQQRYGDAPPLGCALRERFRPRWFRVHSLPGGKRYAVVSL